VKRTKTWKILTVTGAAIFALAMLTTSVYAFGGMMGGFGGIGGMMGGGYGYGYGNGYGYGTNTNSAYPATNIPATTAPSTQYYQPVYPYQFGGCMGTRGLGGYNYGYGYGAAPVATNGQPLTIDTAATIAQNYVASTANPDLQVIEVEEYQANFYVQVGEKSTGAGAFELLINKYTGSVYPEMGPNMMWNTKYGMMRSGILSGIYGAPTTTMPVTESQATANAQQYLDAYLPGTTTGDVTAFYGYFTFEVLSAGSPYGMLSVNGYTGQVWYHNWHRAFIQELQNLS
jgi:hypothetical protein